MHFIGREPELERLDRLMAGQEAALAVVYGRRRIGKTRLLVEWVTRHGGLYTVADQSASEIQRAYLAQAIATRLPGFADVAYPDWRSLLSRLARDARRDGWRGPLVIDELPYLAAAARELPSVLQRWLDHEAGESGLVLALAGSSQRMMQGMVLDSAEPLYGRAREILDLAPLGAELLPEALGVTRLAHVPERYAAWGGVPRYWELAAGRRGSVPSQVDHLVLDPRGPLHREPDRLLLEELPPAVELRPLLDAIGGGVHRVSEIGGRLGRPATSLSRPLSRLIGMGLVRREVPFGEIESKSKRGLYRIADPFFRMWFAVVAPHRAALSVAGRDSRLGLLKRHWAHLAAAAWEDICRTRVPALTDRCPPGALGPWGAASRWWWRNAPEWDLVAESLRGDRLLLGESKWSARPFSARAVERLARLVASRQPPDLPRRPGLRAVVRALLVPETTAGTPREIGGVHVVTADDLLGLR